MEKKNDRGEKMNKASKICGTLTKDPTSCHEIKKEKKKEEKNSTVLKNIKKISWKLSNLGKRYKPTDSRSQGNPKQSKSK